MKSIFILLILLANTSHFYPQKVDFEFDFAQFGFDSTANYIEFYYAFNLTSFNPAQTDSGNYILGVLNVTIEDSATGEIIVNNDWLMSKLIKDSSDLNSSLIGVLGFILNDGSYKCSLSGKDVNVSNSHKVLTDYISVDPFEKMETALSDIQLASNIIQDSDNTTSLFYKNTHEVMPIPQAIFGENQPVLFYYTELYNLQKDDIESELQLDKYVFNSRGQMVESSTKRINREVDSRVEVGTVMVYKLPTDTYTMILHLIDSVANYGVSSSKRFFVYNPSVVATDTSTLQTTPMLSTMFGVMSEDELDDLYSKSEYVASKGERDQYDAITTLEGKKEFMYNFWKARDENPSDNRNDAIAIYLNRIEVSNQRFTALGKQGWKTDRGRVYLVYGEPDEIERFPNQIESRPYEIWRYDTIEGGVIFIFADLTGFSDYQLVHSTKRGELRDDYWSRRIVVQ